MKAVFIRRFGGNEVLEIGERPRPRLRQREVLVRIRAAAVNPRDWMVRSGTYPFRFTLPRFPIVLGGDFAGEIAAIGPGVRRFGIGEEVSSFYGELVPFFTIACIASCPGPFSVYI